MKSSPYVVPPDGVVPPDRMARFIDVRQALAPRCGEVTRITEPLLTASGPAAELNLTVTVPRPVIGYDHR